MSKFEYVDITVDVNGFPTEFEVFGEIEEDGVIITQRLELVVEGESNTDVTGALHIPAFDAAIIEALELAFNDANNRLVEP